MDVAQHWQEALASLSKLSPDQRLIRLVEAPGGDAPPVSAQLASEAVVDRFHGREAPLTLASSSGPMPCPVSDTLNTTPTPSFLLNAPFGAGIADLPKPSASFRAYARVIAAQH